MVGGESQSFNVKLEMPGREEDRPKGRISALTQDTVERWIRLQNNIDEATQDELILMSKRYPDTALKNFVDNFNLMIMRVREKRAKEQE